MDADASGRATVWLRLRVHLHAFRHARHAYLTAAWWYLSGKRLRARAQFAPLLGLSPLAYQLWLLGEERADASRGVGAPLVALVDGAGQGPLAETLRSLEAEGVAALIVGTPDVPDLAAAAHFIASGDDPWLLPLAAGDILATGAGDAYRCAIAEASASSCLIYADDDLIGAAGQRIDPHFKPDWNAELFRHFDYISGACIVRASTDMLSGLAGPNWSTRLAASAASQDPAPRHVRRILHHRRARPAPRVPTMSAIGTEMNDLPSVSVIVPTRNRLDLLRTCLDGLAATDYPDIEIIVVDNGSDDPATLAYLAALDPAYHRVLRMPGPFNFSTLNNRAAREARGRLLCLLNNDIEIIAPDWLAIMVRQALRPEIGAVGARLLYPDGRIQHAGVVLGVGGGAAHAHRLLHPDEKGYFCRHALPQFVSAVTAACLVVRADRFAAVGGLDEANFAVAFNDVDLCMRLNAQGWKSLYEPRATLIHHESVSRGFDRDPIGSARLAGELAALKAAWGTARAVDPYHHPQLSPFSERFVVRL